MTNQAGDRLLTPGEVAEWVGMTTAALAQLRYLGNGPRYRKLTPKTVRYTSADVQAWIDASARQGTADE